MVEAGPRCRGVSASRHAYALPVHAVATLVIPAQAGIQPLPSD